VNMPENVSEKESNIETMNNNQLDTNCEEIESEQLLPNKSSKMSSGKSSSRRVRLLSLLILGFSELLGGCSLSILAPFYSKEAEDHGLSVAQSGTVFASIFVLQILFVPIFGRLITKIGSTRLFIAGVLLAGITNVAFGFLPAIKSGEWFYASSLIMRAVTAVGEAAMNTAVLPLARRRGGEGREASVLSWMETMNGVGTTFGPFIGGILFNYGGFCFPFAVSGGLMIASGLAGILVLDPSEEAEESGAEESGAEESLESPESPEERNRFSVLLRSYSVVLSVTITVTTGVAMQWFQPCLEPYVREQFQLSPYQASMLFVIDGAVYALASPVIGFLLDRCLDPLLCILGGTTTICLGYLLMGPLPPFLIQASLPQVCVGLALLGLGMSANFMGTLTMMSREGEKKGKSNEMAGLITSLWITCENMGSFLGATGGGAAYDKLGWRITCLVIASILMIAVLLIIGGKISKSCSELIRRASRVSKDGPRNSLLSGKTMTGYGSCHDNNGCIIIDV